MQYGCGGRWLCRAAAAGRTAVPGLCTGTATGSLPPSLQGPPAMHPPSRGHRDVAAPARRRGRWSVGPSPTAAMGIARDQHSTLRAWPPGDEGPLHSARHTPGRSAPRDRPHGAVREGVAVRGPWGAWPPPSRRGGSGAEGAQRLRVCRGGGCTEGAPRARGGRWGLRTEWGRGQRGSAGRACGSGRLWMCMRRRGPPPVD